MKVLRSHHLVLAVLLMCGGVSAYEVKFNADSWCTNGISAGSYENNIPEKWEYVNTSSVLNLNSSVEPFLRVAFAA